ncbi:MAG: carbohydrate-binding protein, partial [Bacteroidetes bacterium]|nr:carbohydrate-binding protein [Bacteroidota bacterium]
ELHYNTDGTIQRVQPTAGLTDGVGSLNPYIRQEAETIAWEQGVETATAEATGVYVTAIHNGDYIRVRKVDFKKGVQSFEAGVASGASGGAIEIRLDAVDGPLVGVLTVKNTGGDQQWAKQSTAVNNAKGLHDLYFVFKGGSGELFCFDWWKFNQK